jgi:arabinofuranan 3-O-arabinosyltransferase
MSSAPGNDAARGPEDRFFLPERVLTWGWVLAALYAAILLQCFFAGWLGRGPGTAALIDFVTMWSAGYQAFHLGAAAAYDLAALRQAELRIVGDALTADYWWPYPPTFLFVVVPLAFLPYAGAFLAWASLTLSAYLAVLRAIVPLRATLAAGLASPAAFWNFYAGQNGFLTAALIGSSLLFMDRRPAVAGICLGLLTYKPQFGLLFPLVLMLTGRWRCFGFAALTATLFAAASYLVFGAAAWEGFASSFHTIGGSVLDQGDLGWSKLQTVYGLVRWLGGSGAVAWACHGLVGLMTAAAVCAAWLRPLPYPVQAAALAAATLVLTPYLFVYDLVALAVPVAFLVQAGLAGGFLRGERWVLLGGAALLLFPACIGIILPVGPPLLAALAGLIVRRVRRAALPLAIAAL